MKVIMNVHEMVCVVGDRHGLLSFLPRNRQRRLGVHLKSCQYRRKPGQDSNFVRYEYKQD